MDILYLNSRDIETLALTDAEIIGAIEESLRAQGNGQTSIEPRVHINPDPAYNGHFNVLRGYIAPKHVAGVKIVGDYVYNYKRGLPSEMAVLNLFDPETGAPYAIIDATAITAMRTGALTAVGAKYLAKKKNKILGHLGCRGTAFWNVVLAAAQPSGTSCFSTRSMISRKSESTAGAWNRWRPSRTTSRHVCIRKSR